jgi:hypothetical protein
MELIPKMHNDKMPKFMLPSIMLRGINIRSNRYAEGRAFRITFRRASIIKLLSRLHSDKRKWQRFLLLSKAGFHICLLLPGRAPLNLMCLYK